MMCPTQAAGIKLALLGSLCASSPLTALRLDGSTGLALGNITVVRNAFGGYHYANEEAGSGPIFR